MNARAFWISFATLAAVWIMMAGEAALSAFNERVLRARGAVEAPGDVYDWMRWAWPGGFALLAVEGALAGPASPVMLGAGLGLFGLAKALKGPYRFMRHPNYFAVLGEIAGVALALEALVTGALFFLAFGALIRRRIRIEDAALAAHG